MINRAWFYVAYNHFKIDKVISGVPQSLATDLGLFDNFTTKESAKVSNKDTLVGYYPVRARKQKPLRGLSATTPPGVRAGAEQPSWAYNGRWQRTWSNRLFTEVNVGDFGYDWPMAPNVDYTTHPPRHDNGTGADVGAGWQNAGVGVGPGEIRAAEATGVRQPELLPADERGQPRSEDRVRVHQRSVAERRERRVRTDSCTSI